MNQILQYFIKLGVVTFVSIFYPSLTWANELESIPAVHQLQYIHSTDWEFQVLQSLSDDYHCGINFQNSHVINRYEFALGLNQCLQQIENITSEDDLIALQRLQQDFAQELTDVRSRVAKLETNINQLESHQFSPTTKFNGQVLFFVADSFSNGDDSQTFSGFRTRLDFDTSFYGKDLLKLRWENRDIGRLDDVTDTSLSRLSVDGSSDEQTELAELSYTFALSDRTKMVLGTTGVGLNDIGEVLNPFSSSGSGAISRFARRDPATLRGPGGSGIGIKHQLSEAIFFNAGYVIDSQNAANPQAGRGLFNSSASAIAQILIEPRDDLALALTYTHSYSSSNLLSGTGVAEANKPFGNNATTANNFGLQFNWEINSSLEIGGWFGYTKAQQKRAGNAEATILNGALTLAFPDLIGENNVGGIIIGVPPAIANHDNESLITDKTPLHIEMLYRIEVNDNIEVTPGAFALLNPDNNDGETIWVGVVRIQFSF